MGNDVLQALNESGFEKYTVKLKEFMENYNQSKEDQRNNIRAPINTETGSNTGIKRGIDMVMNDNQRDLNIEDMGMNEPLE